jgi:hypothetical protein
MIELSDRIGGRISGGRVEAVDKSTMPLDAEVVLSGGQWGEKFALGTSSRDGSKERRRSRRSHSADPLQPSSPRRGGLRQTIAAAWTTVFAGSVCSECRPLIATGM